MVVQDAGALGGADVTQTVKDAVYEAAPSSRAPGHEGRPGAMLRSLTFRQRVTLAFAVVAVTTTMLFVVVLAVMWNRQFATYTRETIDSVATNAATQLAKAYDARGYWNTSTLESAASSVLGIEDIGIQVINKNDLVVYDSTWVDTSSSRGRVSENISLAPSDSSQTVSKPIVSVTGDVVGVVRVWVYGSELLQTPRDLSFRSKTFRAICIAGVAAVILSVVLGLAFSRVLTRPVRIISSTARRIKEGDLSARTNVRGDDDLGQLGEMFDEMSEAIERDREREHRLTSDVAHELRTPLMSILATVDAMQDEVLPADQEHLAIVASETKRLSRLVDSMLRLSRLESGSVRLDFEQIDLIDLAREIAASHEMLLADMGLTLAFENRCGAPELIVELDRDTVTQAVTNIISNAMRYTEPPGSVTVGVGLEGSEATIAVTDTGIGIAPEDIDRVFARFWRAEESRSRVAGGLGVGLALTKEIVEVHHGRICVESQKGRGTTFTLRLPLQQPR